MAPTPRWRRRLRTRRGPVPPLLVAASRAAAHCSRALPQGFNRSFAGKNAVRLGRGSYFATYAGYSAQHTYAPPDRAGCQRVLVASVLVGEYCLGKSGAPTPDERRAHKLFDSTVDDVSRPEIFVSYQDAQAYPTHVITFQRLSR